MLKKLLLHKIFVKEDNNYRANTFDMILVSDFQITGILNKGSFVLMVIKGSIHVQIS